MGVVARAVETFRSGAKERAVTRVPLIVTR
jgi:hypothetical protein